MSSGLPQFSDTVLPLRWYNINIMSNKKRCAIYCRVSSEESRDSGLSIEVQIRACEKAAKEKGFVVVETFKDEAISAYLKKPRPAYTEMLSRLPEFDAILVYKLCRFGRREREIHNAVGVILEAGLGFFSVTEGFDLLTPMGRAMMGVTATFAELWSAMTQERVQAAVLQAASEGRKHSFPPYGYTRPVPKEPIIPDPEKAPVVRRIFAEYAGGASLVQICRDLQRDGIKSPRGNDIWHPTIVRQMLGRMTYIGKVTHGRSGRIFEGLHDGIVDRETFDVCQQRLTANKYVHPRSRSGSLSHIIRCGYCGAHLHVMPARNGGRLYHCRDRLLSSSRHKPVFIKAEIIEGYIWTMVRRMVLPEAETEFANAMSETKPIDNSAIEILKQEQSQIENEIKYHLRAASAVNLSMELLKEQIGPLQQRLGDVVREIESLRGGIDLDVQTDFLEQVEDVVQSSYTRQREFLSRIFSRVEVFGEKIVFWSVVPDAEPLTVERQRFGGRQEVLLTLRIV